MTQTTMRLPQSLQPRIEPPVVNPVVPQWATRNRDVQQALNAYMRAQVPCRGDFDFALACFTAQRLAFGKPMAFYMPLLNALKLMRDAHGKDVVLSLLRLLWDTNASPLVVYRLLTEGCEDDMVRFVHLVARDGVVVELLSRLRPQDKIDPRQVDDYLPE